MRGGRCISRTPHKQDHLPPLGLFRGASRLNVGNCTPETLWRDEQITVHDESLDLVPIDRFEVEPEAHPAVMVHVRGPVETGRIRPDQRLAAAPCDLADDPLDPLVAAWSTR
jgi:hypothetical protein